MFKTAIIAGLIVTATTAAACVPEKWQRHDGPVFRDKIMFGLYEVASDAQVFVTQTGQRAMIYSGDDNDQQGIKLALGSSWTDWKEWGVLLGPSVQPNAIRSKETPFYHRVAPNDHRIYFIGYADETTYESQIYMAQAPALTGPWEITPEPVIRRGMTAGRDVKVITSPSVIAQDDGLLMAWLGWDGFEDVTEVWTFTATSDLDGKTWSDITQTHVPIGMEGQITRRPDGGYVSFATRETDSGVEGIFASCAETAQGPWTDQPEPILMLANDGWEVDEIIAPAIVYDPQTEAPYLYYTAAEHSRGWRIMLATPAE